MTKGSLLPFMLSAIVAVSTVISAAAASPLISRKLDKNDLLLSRNLSNDRRHRLFKDSKVRARAGNEIPPTGTTNKRQFSSEDNVQGVDSEDNGNHDGLGKFELEVEQVLEQKVFTASPPSSGVANTGAGNNDENYRDSHDTPDISQDEDSEGETPVTSVGEDHDEGREDQDNFDHTDSHDHTEDYDDHDDHDHEYDPDCEEEPIFHRNLLSKSQKSSKHDKGWHGDHHHEAKSSKTIKSAKSAKSAKSVKTSKGSKSKVKCAPNSTRTPTIATNKPTRVPTMSTPSPTKEPTVGTPDPPPAVPEATANPTTRPIEDNVTDAPNPAPTELATSPPTPSPIGPIPPEPTTSAPTPFGATSSPTSSPTPSLVEGTSSPTSSPMRSLQPSIGGDGGDTVAPVIAGTSSPILSIEPTGGPVSAGPSTAAPTSFPGGAVYFRGFEQGFLSPDLDPEWSTEGDAPWERTNEQAASGVFSIRSPELSNVELTPGASNVTLVTDAWPAGSLFFSVYPSVEMPFDGFSYFVNGSPSGEGPNQVNPAGFEEREIQLGPGPNEITFSYQYNPIPLEDDFPPEQPGRIGAVFLDDVYFVPGGGGPEPSTAPTPATPGASVPSCVPLDPNPDNFEDGTFPLPPWSTGGDGDWALSTEKAFNGTTSLKSPDLDGSQVTSVSNATLQICDDFLGGVLHLQVIASVFPPNDIFIIYVDGESEKQLVNTHEWKNVTLELEPGPHRVDFSYQYNTFGLETMPPSSSEERLGAVWIDVVALETLA